MNTSLECGMQRRTELLLGEENMARINNARVLIFGIGGVGSWCAECLVRSGVKHITIVDADRVCITNCNRQLVATSKTFGQVKVEALKARLLEVNPYAEVEALQKVYNAESAESFHMEEYDAIIDAIDSLSEKADLILRATSLPERITFVSSMGAALRIDPFQVRKAEFWKVNGDPLARAIRKKFKKQGVKPARKFFCVYSEEKPMENLGTCTTCNTAECVCRNYDNELNAKKVQVNGSLCHITSIFGMSIAGIVLSDLIGKR